jgi:hypothetical protein
MHNSIKTISQIEALIEAKAIKDCVIYVRPLVSGSPASFNLSFGASFTDYTVKHSRNNCARSYKTLDAAFRQANSLGYSGDIVIKMASHAFWEANNPDQLLLDV